MGKNKKIIVISGVNIREGGALTIFETFLSTINKEKYSNYRVIALVSEKKIFSKFSRVELKEYPNIKKNWINRIIFEYVGSFFISKRLKPDIWFSIHDISPNVIAKKRIVYCHNPAPFYKLRFKDFYFDFKFTLFNFFYIYLYKINLNKNSLVLVQQNWLKNRIKKFVPNSKIKICRPNVLKPDNFNKILKRDEKNQNKKFIVLYPAFPRTFKNFETLSDSIYKVDKSLKNRIELRLTLSGNENRYSKYLYNLYRSNRNIKFLGKLSHEKTLKEIMKCDILAFPSLLETFGLPIIEAKQFDKVILLSDLPYARETCGFYKKVKFLPPLDSKKWALAIESVFRNNIEYDMNSLINYSETIFNGWDESINLILQ